MRVGAVRERERGDAKNPKRRANEKGEERDGDKKVKERDFAAKAEEKYFDKKVRFLGKQMETLQPILQQKIMIRDDVMEVMQYKIQMQQQVQKLTWVILKLM